MTRRRLLLFGLLATLIGLGAVVWLLWPHTAITRENAARIQVGMTLAEVETILGGPPRADQAGKMEIDFNPDPIENEKLANALEEKVFGANPGLVPLSWRSDEVVLLAQFDDGKVTACAAFPVRPETESVLDKLRRWLRL